MHDVIELTRPGGELPIHRWLPAASTGPGLLVIQEIFGVSDYIIERCEAFAAAGYVVYSPDLYFRLGQITFDESSSSYLPEAMATMQRLDWDQTCADTSAALDALREAPEVVGGVGVVGYCFGGGVGFQVAATNPPDVLVSYYGSAIPGLLDLAGAITCPSQHHWGLADSYFPSHVVEQVEKAVTAGGQAEFHSYPGAEHAFDNPNPMFHQADGSALARERTMDFLSSHLPA